jgi:hypothetical protein
MTRPYGDSDSGKPSPSDGTFSDEELRKLAVSRLKQKKAFRTHLFSFIVVNAMLWIIWLVIGISAQGSAWFPWPIFPTLGWGVGLAFNWRSAYGPVPRPVNESDVEAEMRRLRGE